MNTPSLFNMCLISAVASKHTVRTQNLALVGKGMGTARCPQYWFWAVFGPFLPRVVNCSLYTDQAQIWHGRVQQARQYIQVEYDNAAGVAATDSHCLLFLVVVVVVVVVVAVRARQL